MKTRLSSIVGTCCQRQPTSVWSRFTECNWHRMSVSFWCSFALLGWGTSLVVIGTTLLDLAHHVSVDVGTVSLIFISRAIGSLIGVIVTGVIVDKLKRYLYTTIFFTLTCYASCIAVVPLSIHFVMLLVFMLFLGVMAGSSITVLQFTTLKLWGDRSGPANQFLHFCFSIGAFISPLIAKPFISDDTMDTVNTTCMLPNQSAFILVDPGFKNDSDCSIDTGCSLPSNETGTNSNFAYAYWSTLSLLVPSLIAFLYFAFRHELFQKCISSSTRTNVETPTNDSCDHKLKHVSKEKPQPLGYRVIILSLLFCFLFIYVGMEVTFGNLIFTAAVTGELCFSKSSAALLQSVFWGAFAFMRFFSISLALLKVRASVMLIGNLSGSLLASIIMVFYPHNTVAIWIGSAVLGMSFASVYPTVMTWVGENIQVSGISTAVVMCGGVVGNVCLPALMGTLIAHVTPDSLIYATFVSAIASLSLVAVLFTVATVHKRRNNGHSLRTDLNINAIQYNRLDHEDSNSDNAVDEEINLERLERPEIIAQQCNGHNIMVDTDCNGIEDVKHVQTILL